LNDRKGHEGVDYITAKFYPKTLKQFFEINFRTAANEKFIRFDKADK